MTPIPSHRLKLAALLLPSLLLLGLSYHFRTIRLDPIPYGNGAMEMLMLWGFVVNVGTFLAGYLLWVPDWLKYRSVPRFIGHFIWIGFAAVALKVLMISVVFHAYGYEPSILEPLLTMIPPIYLIFAWGLIAIGGGVRFAEAWVIEQQLRRELEHQRTSAELAQLKRQVNPHFLFNTLNNLYALALREEAEQTAEAIMTLSTMMRTMVHEVDTEWVPLDRELNYLRAYIDLQKLRLPSGHQLEWELNVDGEAVGQRVPPMMLMTLVENAFKHGISFKAPSPILIHLQVDAAQMTFSVRNRVHPHKTPIEGETSGFGLTNLAERLAWYGQESAGLTYGERDGWFEARLIPPRPPGNHTPAAKEQHS